MIGDDDRRATNVVGVIRFGELVALASQWIRYARAYTRCRRIRRIYFHFYGVDTWRNYGLAVSTIENKVLTAQLEYIGV